MAFGMMQSKWGILQRPLGCTLANMLWMVQAIARLHNFCINERLEVTQTSFEVQDDEAPGYIPTVPHDVNGEPVSLDGAFETISDGHSFLREYMATRVEKKQFQHPVSNKRMQYTAHSHSRLRVPDGTEP
jgi:hypothetical protein